MNDWLNDSVHCLLAGILYNCSELASGCSLCLGSNVAGFECGWCSEDTRCTAVEECSKATFSTSIEMCPLPVITITSVNYKESASTGGSLLAIIIGSLISVGLLLVSVLVIFCVIYRFSRRVKEKDKQLTALMAHNSESKQIELTSIKSSGKGWTIITIIMKGTKMLTLSAGRDVSYTHAIHMYACDTYVRMRGTVIGGLVHFSTRGRLPCTSLLRVSHWLATLLGSTRESILALCCNVWCLQGTQSWSR